jgi:hypothetical protein
MISIVLACAITLDVVAGQVTGMKGDVDRVYEVVVERMKDEVGTFDRIKPGKNNPKKQASSVYYVALLTCPVVTS